VPDYNPFYVILLNILRPAMNVLVQIYVLQMIICKKKLLNIKKKHSSSHSHTSKLSVNNEQRRLSNICYCSSL